MQRSEQWKADRLCVLTGTRAYALMNSAATRKTLMVEMLTEQLTAATKSFNPTKAVQKGIDDEPIAENYARLVLGYNIHSTDDFIVSEFDPFCAVSPDGLVGDDGGIEIKNLSEANHIRAVIDDEPEKKYVWQIHWLMYVTGRDWCDYIGYCKELPEPACFYNKRYERDESIIEKINNQVDSFKKEFDINLEKLGFSL
jgi:hypothetical protein